MCGRSSSGPAAAASLQVVSSARACTSGTWEGRPAQKDMVKVDSREVNASLQVGGQACRGEQGCSNRVSHTGIACQQNARQGEHKCRRHSAAICTFLQQQRQRNGDGLAPLRRRCQLAIGQPQRQAPHSPVEGSS